LKARFKRVKAAWETQKPGMSESETRIFDLTLNSIDKLINSGSKDSISEAKSSLDDFVRDALRGAEP
jgi:hypothetical protein